MNTPESSSHDRDGPRDDPRQELLDYLFGCHDDPQALEARLARDPSLQQMLEETRPLAALLTEASSGDAPSEPWHDGVASDSQQRSAASTLRPARKLWQRPWMKVAALFVALASVPGVLLAMRAHELASATAGALRLVVSGPPGIHDAAGGQDRKSGV